MEFLSLGGGMGYYASPSQDPRHRDDPLDVAVVPLPPHFTAELNSTYEFLLLSQMDPTDPSAPQPSAYMVCGFPTVLSEAGPLLYRTTGMCFGGIRYTGNASDIMGFIKDIHVAIAYTDEGLIDTDGTRRTLIDPSGASGCGIWRTIEAGSSFDSGLGQVKLVALLQREEKKPPVLIGTQIEYPLWVLAQNYPSLRSAIRIHQHTSWQRAGWRFRVL